MTQFLQFTLTGLATGTTYAMVGLGIALVYQVTGVINFVQGDFVMFGGLLFAILEEHGWPALPAAGTALPATAALGALLYLGVIAPARRATPDRLIILTIGASIIVEGGTLLLLGADPHFARPFLAGDAFRFHGVSLQRQYVWVLLATALAVAAMALVLTRTVVGKAMRATAMDPGAARLVGISPRRMSLLAFTAAAGLAAVGGIVLAPIQQPDASTGIPLGLTGFAAAVLGGLDSPAGAVAGGLVVGLLQAYATGYGSSGYRDTVVYLLLLAVLLVRPTGLLRRGHGLRRPAGWRA